MEDIQPAGVPVEGEPPVVNFNYIVEAALEDGDWVVWAAMDMRLDTANRTALLTDAYRSDEVGGAEDGDWEGRHVYTKVMIQSNQILVTKVS